MSKIAVPLLIFVLITALILLVNEGMSQAGWKETITPTAWRAVIPSTSTPVPAVERTQWWAEITPPTPKPTVTETQAK